MKKKCKKLLTWFLRFKYLVGLLFSSSVPKPIRRTCRFLSIPKLWVYPTIQRALSFFFSMSLSVCLAVCSAPRPLSLCLPVCFSPTVYHYLSCPLPLLRPFTVSLSLTLSLSLSRSLSLFPSLYRQPI